MLSVYVQFKARVQAQLQVYKDPHCPRRSPVKFTQAIPYMFEGSFPVMYVVKKNVVADVGLFGAHTVVLPETAENVRSLLRKRKQPSA